MHVSKLPLYADYCNYLVTKEIPLHWSKNQRDHFLSQVRYFYWDEPDLFRYCADQVFRRCVPEEEFQSILSFCHAKACGGHYSGKKTAAKVLQSGFFWPTLHKDAYIFCKQCLGCQQMGSISRRDSMPMTPILVVDVFDVWGIDFMGPFPPSFSYLYILVAVDYVSKWVEAVATRTNDHKVVFKFIKHNIFSRFGVPRVMISDVELEHRAFWTIKKFNFDMAKAGENKKLELSELEEISNDAYESSRITKERMKAFHDKHISMKTFEPEQKVWIYSARLHLFPGKLRSRWEGPAIVQEVYSNGAVRVKKERDRFTVNVQRLKPYIDGASEPTPEEIELIDVSSIQD
ncbi:unnamed protein product [Victoria cruziana]